MHPLLNPLSLSLLASQAFAAATLYLAGDSTCATWPSTSVIQGWGASFPDYTTLTVSNQAVSGRSARSYTREGRFDTIASTVKSGDFVVMEFGHNDGGSLTPTCISQ
jgi:rhamnogalacturonan acetylesterase